MEPMRKSGGFTLAELLIVIVILGILGGMALPRLFPQVEKSRVAEAIGILSAIRKGEEAYKLEYGGYLHVDGRTDTGENVSQSSVWLPLGMVDPHSNPNRLFNYAVKGSGCTDGLCTTYKIWAVRNTNDADFNSNCTAENAAKGLYAGCEIILDQDGNWDGRHPYKPS